MEPLSDDPAKCCKIQDSLPHSRFRIDGSHVLERLSERYRDSQEDPARIVTRVMDTLENNTPDDWRFTESPASRFFILDEKSGVKLMGMTYRDSEKVQALLSFLRENTQRAQEIHARLEGFIRQYADEILNSQLAIIHQHGYVRGLGGRQRGTAVKVFTDGGRENLQFLGIRYSKQ